MKINLHTKMKKAKRLNRGVVTNFAFTVAFSVMCCLTSGAAYCLSGILSTFFPCSGLLTVLD